MNFTNLVAWNFSWFLGRMTISTSSMVQSYRKKVLFWVLTNYCSVLNHEFHAIHRSLTDSQGCIKKLIPGTTAFENRPSYSTITHKFCIEFLWSWLLPSTFCSSSDSMHNRLKILPFTPYYESRYLYNRKNDVSSCTSLCYYFLFFVWFFFTEIIIWNYQPSFPKKRSMLVIVERIGSSKVPPIIMS